MIFKEVSKLYNMSNYEVQELKGFIYQLKKITDLYDKLYNFTFIDTSRYSSYSTQHSSDLMNMVNTTMKDIKYYLSTLNMFVVGRIITSMKHNLIELSNNDISSYINRFLNKTEDLVDYIYKFLDSSDSKNNSINAHNIYKFIIDYVFEYENFINVCILLNNIETSLDNSYDDFSDEDISTLSLHYYNVHVEIDQMINIMGSVNELYSKLCDICDISDREFKLQPIKIESGSFFEYIKGNKKIFKLMERLMKFVYYNFTKEGNDKRNNNHVMSNIDLIDHAKECGITLSEESEKLVNENIQQVLKHTKVLINSGPLKINDESLGNTSNNSNLIAQNEIKYLSTVTSE